MSQSGANPAVHSPRMLMRGESVIASTGLALAMILVLVTGAAAWWTMHMEREALLQARRERLHTVGELLVTSSEHALAQDAISSVRTLLVDAKRDRNLRECRIVLPDGKVLADTDPSRINVTKLPEAWGPVDQAPQEPTSTLTDGVMTMVFPMLVAGRGAATLEMSVDLGLPFWAHWQAQAGLGAIGAAGLAALLAVYRRMRIRLRALGAIGEALSALERGESGQAALAVSSEFGAEAAGWNKLLAEREKLRSELVAERAKEALGNRRAAGSDLVQACDAMWQGLIVVDEKLKAKYANGAAAAFLRIKREEISGSDVASLIEDPKVVEALRAVAEGSVRRRTTVELRRTDQEGGSAGILRFSVRPVRKDDSAAAIIMIEDVTQQRVADEARNAFVAQATHELRTPLTNIRLYVEQAIEEGEKDAQVRTNCLNVISQESRRLERIVGDMLSVAEIEAGSLKLRTGEVRLETVFEELETDFAAQAKDKGLRLRFELPPKLPAMRADRDKLVLALHNLVGNAIKYTPTGGDVTVKIEADDAKLAVAVTDTGIGISDEESELVFEKFYRAKDKRVTGVTGSGLGLALAREVVRLHGGDITLRSQIDKGSTFTLSMPTIAA